MIFGLVQHAVKKKQSEECANALMLITILNTVQLRIGETVILTARQEFCLIGLVGLAIIPLISAERNVFKKITFAMLVFNIPLNATVGILRHHHQSKPVNLNAI